MNEHIVIQLKVLALFGLVFLLACNADPLPTVVQENPVMLVKGKFGTEDVNLQAGINDYYNFSEMEVVKGDYYVMTSTIKPKRWDYDKAFVSLTMVDQGPMSEVDPSDRYSMGALELIDEDEWHKEYSINISPIIHDGVSVDEICWVNDGTLYFTDTLHLTLFESGSYFICLKAISNCETIHTCKYINTSGMKTYNPNISISSQDEDSVKVQAYVGQMECDQWMWDGVHSSKYSWSYPKNYIVGHHLGHVSALFNSRFAMDISYILEKELDNVKLKAVDFDYAIEDVEFSNDLFGMAHIDYFHPEKGYYSSRFASNVSNHSLDIVDVQTFIPNENGIPTVQVTVKGEVLVASEFGDEVRLTLEEAVFALPQPE